MMTMIMKRGHVISLTLLIALSCVTATSIVTSSSPVDDFEHLTVTEMCALLPGDSSFLRPNTCNSWVRCASSNNTRLEEGSCASGLSYNKESGRCALSANVSCPYSAAALSTNICATESDGTFLEDPTSCRNYILCKNRIEVRAKCPNELVFNPNTKSCVYTYQYTCPTAIKKDTTPICRAIADGTRVANDVHCHKYFVCTDGILKERECGAGAGYDVFLGRCMIQSDVTCYATAVLPPPENTFCLDNSTNKARVGYFADDQSCSHYYICDSPVNGKHDTEPQHLECSIGQYFDYEKLSCRDRLNVRCPLDRCVGSQMTYVNVAGNCKSYGRCSGGVTVSLGTCPDNTYFDERIQGCTVNNHNYIACAE